MDHSDTYILIFRHGDKLVLNCFKMPSTKLKVIYNHSILKYSAQSENAGLLQLFLKLKKSISIGENCKFNYHSVQTLLFLLRKQLWILLYK